MNKIKLSVDNSQKEKSFELIKIIINDFSKTLGELSDNDPSNDIFMRTTKNLFNGLHEDIQEILESKNSSFELSVYNVHIFKDALEFYWQNSKQAFVDFNETDFINAQRLLSGTSFVSFVK
jgi:hypothetical protein